jgi:hypothetical protein
VAVLVFSRPWVAAASALVALAAARLGPARVALVVAPAVVLGLSRALEEPELAWLALGLLLAGWGAGAVVRSRR